jgi:outer membrane protein OmpA-like peptidoglycan-associated protein
MSPRPSRPAAGRAPVAAYGTLALLVLAAAPAAADAQGFADRLRRKAENAAKRAVETRVERRTTEGTNEAMDAAERGARRPGRAGDAAAPAGGAPAKAPAGPAPAGAAAGAPHGPAAPGADAAPPPAPPLAGAAGAPRPGEGAWANYDFVPGERVLFADDFATDRVGDFPRRLAHGNGGLELVVWQGRRWLRAGGTGDFAVPLPGTLPERFTLEFELAGSGNAMEVYFADPARHRGPVLRLDRTTGGLRGGGLNFAAQTGHDTSREPVAVRVQADGTHLKVYVGETRVANVPNAEIGRADRIWFRLNGWSPAAPRMVADLRVASGGRDLYRALADSGRVATRGIYFETASDQLRPESTPTLREIAALLAGHEGLRLTIEGHTDAAGDARANHALSERRAAAVRGALVELFGADGARLAAVGRGADRPAASNATAEGRQMNRRVELVRR